MEDALVFSLKCSIRQADGSECPVPASHSWGPVHFCCMHFDEFAKGLLRTKELPQAPRHIDIVEEWNRQCHRDSRIPGTKCETND